jgi:hypothetical protein
MVSNNRKGLGTLKGVFECCYVSVVVPHFFVSVRFRLVVMFHSALIDVSFRANCDVSFRGK